MLKKICKSLLCLGMIVTLFPSFVHADEQDKYEQFIESFVYTIDDKIVDAEFVKPLKDLQGKESFLLYKIDDTGYSVIAKSNMNISELYDSSHFGSNYFDDKTYYISPGVFYTDEQYSSFLITPTSTTSAAEESTYITDLIEIQAELTEEELNIEYLPNIQPLASPITTKPSELGNAAEYGIPDSRMTPYKNHEWTNTTSYGYDYQYKGEGICGSISAAIALSYIDRYISSAAIVNAPYSFGDPKFAEWLILYFKNRIEPPMPGSFASDIVSGINAFYLTSYSDLGASYLRPYSSNDRAFQMSNIKDGYPVILYLNAGTAQGSPYGMHWVTGYRYSTVGDVAWFKVADNWENLAWVNKYWVNDGVYFQH